MFRAEGKDLGRRLHDCSEDFKLNEEVSGWENHFIGLGRCSWRSGGLGFPARERLLQRFTLLPHSVNRDGDVGLWVCVGKDYFFYCVPLEISYIFSILSR